LQSDRTLRRGFAGQAVEEHIARGGQLGSRWTAFWVGIATLAGLVVVVGAVICAYPYRRIAVVGTRYQIIYSG
jgi:hypothetical protein